MTTYHFIGVGGIGMSGLAELLVRQGHRVTGSDLAENAVTRRLEGLGVTVYLGHRAGHLGAAEVVVHSTAVKVAFVERQVMERIPVTDLAAESGFHWYPVNKLELQFINIRHIQQHTSELYETLGMQESTELRWVGYSKSIKENE